MKSRTCPWVALVLLVACGESSPTPTVDGGGRGDGSATADSGASGDAAVSDSGPGVGAGSNQWTKIEPPGATCSDGSPYKLFVDLSDSSNDVVIFFEGGGACWDYASCSGEGARTAANLNGLPDEHADALATLSGVDIEAGIVYPLLNASPTVSPVADWNKVFVPYCTGDIYSGSTTVTYEDPDGIGEDFEFQHVGHQNVLAAIEALSPMLPALDRMLVSGCSAGGAGATTNYAFIREGLNPSRGYLVADSGPIFPNQAPTSRSLPLHTRVQEAWNAAALIDALPSSMLVTDDFGDVNTALAAEYPSDRLAVAFFRLDYNYSLYSYERFYRRDAGGMLEMIPDGDVLIGLDENVAADRAEVYRLWFDDTALLRTQFEGVSNLAYFMPYYRATNSSHCVGVAGFEDVPLTEAVAAFLAGDISTFAWAGTDIMTTTGSVNYRDFVEQVLDDTSPLDSYFEETPEGPFVPCTPESFDAMACEEATP